MKHYYVIHIKEHAAIRYMQRFETNLTMDEATKKLEQIANGAKIFARHHQLTRNNEVALRNKSYPDVVLIAEETGKEVYVITCEVYSKSVSNWWKESINHETTKKELI